MTSSDIFSRGRKTFWKTRTTVDVVLVEHQYCDVLEVVCSNAATLQQAPRLYIRKSILRNEISDDEIQSRVLDSIDKIYERTKEFDRDILVDKAWKSAMYEYIEERLELHQRLRGTKGFHVLLRKPLYSEGFDEFTEVALTCDAPASLIPYELIGFAPPRESVMKLARGNPASNTLGARDRLRIPFIFIKVSKVMHLRNSEVRIWQRAVSNILRDSEVHERQAIINLESTVLCAEFAVRQCARMRSVALIPASSNKYTRPPLLDTFSVASVASSVGSGRHRDHRSKPSTPRFADPSSTRSVSSKLGLDSFASSLQKGFQSLGSSKNNAPRPATTGGGRRPSRAAADQSDGSEGLARKKSMIGMMMGGQARRDSRAHTPQRSPSRNQSRAGKVTSARGDTPPESLLPLRNQQGSGLTGFVDETDITSEARMEGVSNERSSREWFGGMSRKLTGLVSSASGKLSAFSTSGKHRLTRVGVSGDDDDCDVDDGMSCLQTVTTASTENATTVTADPAFAPVGGLGSTVSKFIGNLSGKHTKHTASSVIKVKGVRDEGRGTSSPTAGSPVASAVAAPHRVTDSTLAPAPQIFQHITMWGGRVVIRPATSKTQRDILLRFK